MQASSNFFNPAGERGVTCYVAGMSRFANLAVSATCLAGLSACSSTSGDYPSLAIRDVERVEGRFEAGERRQIDVPEVEVELAGGLDAQLAQLVAAARTAHERFTALVPQARRRVAAAGSRSVASDAWGSAQVAVAELEAARSVAAVPLGDLEAIYVSQTVQAAQSPAMLAAREQVLGWIAEEDAVLAELGARLGR